MKRVLVVAYYFPPIGGIGSIRLAGFATHLPEFGWEPTVLAPRGTPHPVDPSLMFPEEGVVRSRSVELSRLAHVVPRRQPTGTAEDRGVDGRLRGLARRLVYPDSQVGWYPGATRSGLRAMRRHRFDAVYSSSFPITAHLVARTLSRRSGLPWVAEFRDPWSDRLPPGHPHVGRAEALETSIAGCATGVVMPTPTWAAHYGARWGRDVSVLRNGHDIGPVDSAPPDLPVLTHMGSFYPEHQSLSPLWQALKILAREEFPLAPRVRFVGELHSDVRAGALPYGVGERVEVTGFVPHDEAMSLLRSSSMLFAIGPGKRDAVARGWVPAKLFEYLASGLPILFIGDPTGDAGRLLDSYPACYVVESGDVDAVTVALRRGLAGRAHVKRDVDHLSRRAGARILAGILDGAVASCQQRGSSA